MKIILASSSPYRRMLLERLNLRFSWVSPGVDESGRPGEYLRDKATRLAQHKACSVAADNPGAIVIGSDQVACAGQIEYRKPGTYNNALEQLRQLSGKRLTLHTGLCVVNADGEAMVSVVDYEIDFRPFSTRQAKAYLVAEQPFDCAASLKSEALGVILIKRFIGDDPTALIGLPLITLVDMLARIGLNLPMSETSG